ncbi:MAG: sulfurtransferase [Gammaproteobacteria bacterium]|nr:sulfurtransferase [Gammaproteobacteria bacterium]
MVINTPAQIAQVSADNYDDNVNGLITGTTLKRWIDNWEVNRPAGITGRLIILQVNNGPAGSEYITPNPAGGVLTYSVPGSRLTMDRSNGVTTTRSMVPDGTTMDAFLSDYGIDPTRDMLVCAMGAGSAGTAMSMGRCWYMLRYWGVVKEHLAQLNGGAANAGTGVMLGYVGPTATCDENTMLGTPPAPNCLPRSGRVSVRSLPQDNTVLQATMSDVIDVVEGRASALLWDARNNAQYLGTGFQNNGSRAGHPNGALLLEHTEMVDAIGRYKDKATLAAYLNGELPAGATSQFKTDVGGAAVPVGPGNAYRSGTIITYCETTFRAMLTGTVAGVILGIPTRFYDGAMVEWNAMTHIQDKFGEFILPVDSPWRTDTLARSVFTLSTATIDPRIIDDAYYDAPRYRVTNAIIDADKAYKTGATSGGSGGGGGGLLPPSPCGG